MPVRSINGVEIRYEVEGTGPAVAFTPGGFWPLEEAQPLSQALRALEEWLWDNR